MTIIVRCFERDPYNLTVYCFDSLMEISKANWLMFVTAYGLEVENYHRSADDPDWTYSIYSVPVNQSEEVLNVLKSWYGVKSTEALV